MMEERYWCIKCKEYTSNELIESMTLCICRKIHKFELCVNCHYSTKMKPWIQQCCINSDVGNNVTNIDQENIPKKSNPIDIIYPIGRESYYDFSSWT
jgi:hypothetical protein